VTLPGPPGTVWALELLLWAAGAALLGDLVRGVAARWVRSWRELDPVERLVLDLYLGGAVVYLVAAVPVGAFVLPVLVGLPVAAAILVGAREVFARAARGPGVPPPIHRTALPRPAVGVALAIALALFAYELAIALPVGTGNTYDSSLLTTYVALLLDRHTIPHSFAPYASVGLLYPQGTTVWLGWAQALFGLPPARTSLLVTPLFLALAPLGGFVFGRRAFGTDTAALGCAVFLAAVGSWTRVLVGGSNDFAVAFPIVLLLLSQAIAWTRGALPPLPEAIAFGVLVGYSAALNPVGAEWLLPTLLIVGFVTWGRGARAAARWLGRWAAIVAVSLVALVPTLYVLVLGRNNPSLTPGAALPPAGSHVGIGEGTFLGAADPYLFRPTDVLLSPVPLLRAELAVLLTVGLAMLLLAGRWPTLARLVGSFRTFVIPGAIVLIGLLGLLWASSSGSGLVTWFAQVSNVEELAIWLVTLYSLIAVLPFVFLLEHLRARATIGSVPGPPAPSTPARTGRARAAGSSATVALALALVIVVPGVVLSGTSLPPVLTRLYDDFGNVTAEDLAMLSYAGANLPAGARVLVAPGSAAEFLPGYAPNLVLLYPMVPGWMWVNASYALVVSELRNATLDRAGTSALASLEVQYIMVTGWNTVLWPPFSPEPMLADPGSYPLEFHSGDAYLFEDARG
jgi:hypothetical protein